MADVHLQSLLVHRVNVYYLDVTEAPDGQQLEGYPDRWHPDIANMPCAITQDGKTLAESPVGYLIESDAILYCEDQDIPERARVHWKSHVFYVNGTPNKYYHLLGSTPNIPHLMEVGLREQKDQPG